MHIKGSSHQPRFGMYSFNMPNVNTPEEKAQQAQAIQAMIDTFKLQEKDASIEYNEALVIQPRNPRVPVIKTPARIKVDNTTAEHSILGRIQAFFSQHGIEVNPLEGEMESTGNPPFDTHWRGPVSSPSSQTKKKQLRMDPKDHHLD